MDELSAIRAKRLAELSGGSGPSSPSPANIPGLPQQGGSGQQQKEQQQQREDEEEARRQMLGQILSPEARERLSRIALVRPERSRAISELLIRMARSGQLRGRVTEPQLLDVLDQVEANERGGAGGDEAKQSKIVYARRKGAQGNGLDSDDDDDEPPFRPSTSTARRRPDNDDDDDDFDL